MAYECSGSRRSDQCFKWSYGRCSMEMTVNPASMVAEMNQ